METKPINLLYMTYHKLLGLHGQSQLIWSVSTHPKYKEKKCLGKKVCLFIIVFYSWMPRICIHHSIQCFRILSCPGNEIRKNVFFYASSLAISYTVLSLLINKSPCFQLGAFRSGKVIWLNWKVFSGLICFGNDIAGMGI